MPTSDKKAVKLSDLPQGAGSGLDADTLQRKRPTDFLQLGSTKSDELWYQSVTVNTTVTAGSTGTVSITWPTTFIAAPVGWIGNVVSGSVFAQLELRLSGLTASGATLNVFNPTAGSLSPNFVVTVFSLGKV